MTRLLLLLATLSLSSCEEVERHEQTPAPSPTPHPNPTPARVNPLGAPRSVDSPATAKPGQSPGSWMWEKHPLDPAGKSPTEQRR